MIVQTKTKQPVGRIGIHHNDIAKNEEVLGN